MDLTTNGETTGLGGNTVSMNGGVMLINIFFSFSFRMGDKLIGQRKLILLLMAVFAALAAFVFLLIIGQYIPFSIGR